MKSSEKTALKRIDTMVVKFMNFVVIVTSIAITLMICATVVLRYGFETDLYAIDEIETLLAFWLYFIGAAYASYTKRQITADILAQFVNNKKIIKYITIVSCIIGCLVCLIFTKFSVDILTFSRERSQKSLLWRIPMSYMYISIVIGFVLMSVYCFRDMLETIKS